MNKVTLVGRLGQDPEHQTSQNGKTFCKFSLATNDGYGDNKKTNWHSCTAFGKVADIINQYTKKGSELAISGTLDYNKHEDKTYTNILVNDFTFIGGKAENNLEKAKATIDEAFPPETFETVKQEDLTKVDDEDDNLPF